MELGTLKNLELDKICRICLAIKKEMRPLFGEMVAEMLMEIAKIQVAILAWLGEYTLTNFLLKL